MMDFFTLEGIKEANFNTHSVAWNTVFFYSKSELDLETPDLK
jgi:hypothetical protein